MQNEFMSGLARLLESLGDGLAFKSGGAFALGVLGAALGGAWTLVVLLVALLVLDFALGFVRAGCMGAWKRSKLVSGGLKFMFYPLAVFVMALVEQSIALSTSFHLPVRDAFISYLCVNEALSCLEHLSFFGVPVPSGIRGRLREYRDSLSCPPTDSPLPGTGTPGRESRR